MCISISVKYQQISRLSISIEGDTLANYKYKRFSSLFRNPNNDTLPEVTSSPVKYSLLYYDGVQCDTSIVDVETVMDEQVISQKLSSSNNDMPERQFVSDLVTPVENSTPDQATCTNSNSDDLTPSAKRCRRSSSEDKLVQTECVTPPRPRPSPLKNFSIVLSDSLKSPTRSLTPVKKSSPMRSPNSGNRRGDFLQDSQSPKHCVVLLHDITKSPISVVTSPNTPKESGNKRIIRSASVSPEQRKIRRDTLMESPVKEEISTPAHIHTITDVLPKHLYQSRDILLVSSSQTTPQKEYH